MRGQRGLFERPKGSGSWWIRYADAQGKERREKAGTKASAKLLYQKRKQQALEGKKLPEKLRAKAILFNELLDDAVEHSGHSTAAGSSRRNTCRVDVVQTKGLGHLAVDSITPQQISRWLLKAQLENDWKPATTNRYTHLSQSHELAAVERLCQTRDATGTRTGTAPKVPSDAMTDNTELTLYFLLYFPLERGL